MIQVQILDDDDIVEPTDWCRPLCLTTMSGGLSDSYSFKSCYSGSPENNVEWVQVQDVFGPCWRGRTVREFKMSEYSIPREFIRGNVPRSHRLDMKGYSSDAHLWQKKAEDSDD